MIQSIGLILKCLVKNKFMARWFGQKYLVIDIRSYFTPRWEIRREFLGHLYPDKSGTAKLGAVTKIPESINEVIFIMGDSQELQGGIDPAKPGGDETAILRFNREEKTIEKLQPPRPWPPPPLKR